MKNFCDWILKNSTKDDFVKSIPRLAVKLAELLPACDEGYLGTEAIAIDEDSCMLELDNSEEKMNDYMSPELLKGEEFDNHFTSAVFSYGVIVDELIRGCTYCMEKELSKEQLLQAYEEKGDEWLPLDEENAAFNDIITACVKVVPARRIQSIKEMEEMLKGNVLTAAYITINGFHPATEKAIPDSPVNENVTNPEIEESVDAEKETTDGDAEADKESDTATQMPEQNEDSIGETIEEVVEDKTLPEVVIGIDLGTSNSTVSIMRNGRIEDLEIKKKIMVPSVIFFDDKDRQSYGSMALRKASVNPESMFKEFKRLIGYKKTHKVFFKNQSSSNKIYTYIFDTNAVIDEPNILEAVEPVHNIIIPMTVFEELGFRKKDLDTQAQAEAALASINALKKAGRLKIVESNLSLLPEDFFKNEVQDNHNRNDNKILSCACEYDSATTVIISTDHGVAVKAEFLQEHKGTKFIVKKTAEFVFELNHKPSEANYLELTGQDGAVYFLKYLRNEAIKAWGRADKAVITVPNEFDPMKRKEIEEAGYKAGFSEIETNSEPLAAAVAYGMDKEDEHNILVYDFGGGTFDIAIIRKNGNEFKVLNTGGDSKLGGVDFTKALIDEYYEFLIDKYNLDMNGEDESELSHEEYVDNEFKIWETCERMKCNLSEMDSDRSEIKLFVESGKQEYVDFEITRKGFEDLVGTLVQKSRKALDRTLNDIGFSKMDIDIIIMAGGTSTIPCIKTFLQQYFGKAPYADKDPATLIANGAAMLADFKWGKHEGISNKPILIDFTNTTLGVGLDGHIFDSLIEAGTELPVKVTKDDYTLSRDNQPNMVIGIYTCAKGIKAKMTYDDGVDYIGEIRVVNLPPLVCNNTKVIVSFSLNKEGVLEVDARLTDNAGKEIAKGLMKIEHQGV